jgi:hypothetical protein
MTSRQYKSNQIGLIDEKNQTNGLLVRTPPILLLYYFFPSLLLRPSRPVSPEHMHQHIELPIDDLLCSATGGGGRRGVIAKGCEKF